MTTDHQVRSYGSFVSTEDRTQDTRTPWYEVRVRGQLGSRWAAWFDGMDLAADDDDDGITVIRGPLVDQAALHGLLQKLRDVGIPLVSLTPLPSDAITEGPAPDRERNRHGH